MGTVLGTVPIISSHSLVNSGLEPWRDVCPNLLEVEICARAPRLTARADLGRRGASAALNLSI
jgi:hypothetical protein